jgi:predicted Holliday junction resolvase-like endonuclease
MVVISRNILIVLTYKLTLRIIVENEIRELRAKINNHLDQLQEGLMKKLTETEKQITDEARDLMVSNHLVNQLFDLIKYV